MTSTEIITATTAIIGAVTGSASLIFTYIDKVQTKPKIGIKYVVSYDKEGSHIIVRIINYGSKPMRIDRFIVYRDMGKLKNSGVVIEDKKKTLVDERNPVAKYTLDDRILKNWPEQITRIEVVSVTGEEYSQDITYQPPASEVLNLIGKPQRAKSKLS